jgi:O-methyltransferase
MFLFVRRILDSLLPRSVKYSLVRKLPGLEIFCANSLRGIDKLWLRDSVFIDCYLMHQSESLLDVKKAYLLYLCAKKATVLPGDFGEFGVFRGAGSQLMIAASESRKKLLLFDTFEGLPESKGEDGKNWTKGSLSDVSFNELKTSLGEGDFEFYKGYFPESATGVPGDTKFAFVHIDFDLYQSTFDAVRFCYQRMSQSGIMLFDDYGVLGCPGVRKAVDEFFVDKPEMVIPNLNGQGIVIKS